MSKTAEEERQEEGYYEIFIQALDRADWPTIERVLVTLENLEFHDRKTQFLSEMTDEQCKAFITWQNAQKHE